MSTCYLFSLQRWSQHSFSSLHLLTLALVAILTLSGCDGRGSGGGSSGGNGDDVDAKQITAFSFVSPVVDGVINQAAGTIKLDVPYLTNVASLVADFTFEGASVTVNSVEQVSGSTANDFSNQVAYTVTAENGTSKEYSVSVAKAESLNRQELNPENLAGGDAYGISVSTSGDRAIVGAYKDNSNTGAAYIFELQNGEWRQAAELTAQDAASENYFGRSVAISGDRAIVGAIWAGNSGSAYIFELQNGEWKQTKKLTGSDAAASDRFGIAVSISGDTAIVGTQNDSGSSTGSAYIYDLQNNGNWNETKLTASDAAAGDFFGDTVSISGDKAIVGARENDDNGSNSGSAYIFELQNDGSWNEKTGLSAENAEANDSFGSSVSVSSNTAIVGVPGDDASGANSGAAYIFQ